MKYKISVIMFSILFFASIDTNAQKFKDTISIEKYTQKGLNKFPNDSTKQRVLTLWYLLWSNFSKDKSNEDNLNKFLESKSYGSFYGTVSTIIHFRADGNIERLYFSKNMPNVLTLSIDNAFRKSYSDLLKNTNFLNSFRSKKILFETNLRWSLRHENSLKKYIDDGENFYFSDENLIFENVIIAPKNLLIAPVFK